MTVRRPTAVTVLALACLTMSAPASAGDMAVDTSHADVLRVPITVTQLAPPACAGLELTTIVTAATSTPGNGNGQGGGGGNGRGGGNGNGGGGGGGNGGNGTTIIRGTPGNDLVLGTPGADLLDGQGGDDCLVAGGGDDQLDGGPGTDVCLPGGQAGDVTANCETVA